MFVRSLCHYKILANVAVFFICRETLIENKCHIVALDTVVNDALFAAAKYLYTPTSGQQ